MLEDYHIDRLQKVQDNLMIEMFQVSAKGTQKCMLKMRWRIIQMKIRQVAKTMGKPETNLCKGSCQKHPEGGGSLVFRGGTQQFKMI